MRFAAAAAFCLSFAAFAQVSPAECKQDSECTMTTFAGCCGSCCPRERRAIGAAKLKAEQDRCAVVDCAANNCRGVLCPAPKREAVRPVCRLGQCVAEPLGAAECRADGDCELVIPEGAACRSSRCGCCPGSEVAVPLGKPGILTEPKAPPPVTPPPDPKKDPKFGLSSPTDAVQACPVCPKVLPSRAACREGKCIKGRMILEK